MFLRLGEVIALFEGSGRGNSSLHVIAAWSDDVLLMMSKLLSSSSSTRCDKEVKYMTSFVSRITDIFHQTY